MIAAAARFPPFTAESAAVKTRLAEDAWNTRDPVRVAQAYTPDSRWRNRSEFVRGREASINDVAIIESERKFHWPPGRRPDEHPGLTELGL